MAANFKTSKNKGPDVCCSVCEGDGVYKEGLFYCQKCSTTFCNECVIMHTKLHKDHSVSAKGKCDNWPVSKKVDDTLELCEKHATEKLTMFCEDHEKLLCQLCMFHNHRQCNHVVLLAVKCNSSTKSINVAEIATHIEQFQTRLVEALNRSKQNIKSMETSYEIILEEILDFRRRINYSLDCLQQKTIYELKRLHTSFKNSLEDECKQCETFISKIKVHDFKSFTSPEEYFISHRKCLDQTASAELFLRNVTTNADIEFQHNKDLEKCLAAFKDLGNITSRVVVVAQQHVDPNKAIKLQEKSQLKVSANTDMNNCSVTGICEMPNGNVVISDRRNECVKLLDQAYNVIDKVKLTASPLSICYMSLNEVAVIICDDHQSLNEIHFLRVNTGKIIKIEHAQLNHRCYGIAHHKGNMFVTSGTALLKYTTDGRLMKKLYEDKSSKFSVMGVAVSPDGKRIYVTDRHNDSLATLTLDGAIIAMLEDPAFRTSFTIPNLHVAATGQVFVIGDKYVSQVNTHGKKLLATVDVDGCPKSVYFNVDNNKLLVGMLDNDRMSEFKTTS